MEQKIQVKPEHLTVIKNILKKFLPSNANVWVFGSRASNTAKQFSDLDLCIDLLGKALPIGILADLNEAFIESALPYKVDLLDWNNITADFQQRIAAQRKPIDLI